MDILLGLSKPSFEQFGPSFLIGTFVAFSQLDGPVSQAAITGKQMGNVPLLEMTCSHLHSPLLAVVSIIIILFCVVYCFFFSLTINGEVIFGGIHYLFTVDVNLPSKPGVFILTATALLH